MLRRAAKRQKVDEKQDVSKEKKRVKRSRKISKALGARVEKDEAEKVLEQLVIGDDRELVEKLKPEDIHAHGVSGVLFYYPSGWDDKK